MSKNNEEGYGHILKYTGIFGGVQGLIILIGLVRNKVMALLLGAGGMGFNALLVSVQNFASQCTSLGISFGAVPRMSELYEQENRERLEHFIQTVRLWSVMSAVLGFLFCILISPLLNEATFTWGNHTLHYAALGLSVAMMAISGGETAILKATRRLGALAKIQIYVALFTVLVSIPLYYFFYHSGVLPVIVLTALTTMGASIFYSYSFYPLKLRVNRQAMAEGMGMVKLGLAFVLAAAFGSAAEMLIRAFLNVEGGLDDVGLYNAGYMITITYAGMVFSAMESDYFPRLSAVNQDILKTNETVNKQMEVSLLLLSPMLVALLMVLPILIPLIFSKEFLSIIGMTQVAVLSMYFKVLTLPVAYITLARGQSMSFLLLEASYFIVFVLMMVFGFRTWGIYGTGLALVGAHIFDYLMINGYAYWKYGYRCTPTVFRYAAIQLVIGMVAFAVSCLAEGWPYWIAEAVLVVASTAYSVHILRQKTHLWEALKRKFRT